MKKIKFLTHLNTLSPGEVKEFGVWLNAIHHDAEVLMTVYNYYVAFHNSNKTIPSYAEAYEIIFDHCPESSKDIRNLHNSLSDLFLKLKEYLIQQKVMELEFEKEMIWLEVLEERELVHQQSLAIDKLILKSKQSNQSWEQLNELKLLEFQYFNNKNTKEDFGSQWILRNIKILDKFYQTLFFKYASVLLNSGYVVAEGNVEKGLLNIYSISPVFKPILKQISKDIGNYSIQVQHYFYLFEFLANPSEKKFWKIKDFFFQNLSFLHKIDKNIGIVYLANYITRQTKKRKYDNYKVAFELYEIGLNDDLALVHRGRMDDTVFRNILNLAIKLNKLPWAKYFIEKFQLYLDRDIRIDNVQVGKIMLYFEEGAYERILGLNHKTRSKKVLYSVISKIYIIAAKYELGQFDDLENDCKSFIKFAKRSTKLGAGSKETIFTFCKILKLLIEQKAYKSKIQLVFNESKGMYKEDWLKEKIVNYKRFA